MDWMEKLPDRLKTSLESLLDTVEYHEESYMSAENASVGQIWVALAQMNERLNKMEDMVQAQRKVLKEMDKEIDVDQHLDKNLEDSLKRY